MSFYPDANFVLPLCVRSKDAERQKLVERAFRWLARNEMPVVLSPLTEYEVRKQLWAFPEDARQSALAEFGSLKAEWERTLSGWGEAVDCALKIAQDFRTKLHVDSADTLHVGWAEAENCTAFGSLDQNSGTRALAHSRNLRVIPDMGPRDFAHLKRLAP